MKLYRFTSVVCPTALVAAFTACGGGSALGDPEVLLQPHPVASNAGPMDTVAVPTRRMAALGHALDASSFLNWAESAYPGLFAAPQSNKTIDVWTYRYYPKTDIYLGTNTSGDVLGLVGKGGGQYDAYPLGKLVDFGCSVYPSDCAMVNVAPVANAGVAQNVVAGSVVTLDGSASSDANSDPLTYAWTLTSKPAGSTAALSSATSAKPTFTADVAGTYVASVVVNDGKVSSTSVTVSIGASDPCANTLGNQASFSYDWSLATQKVTLKNNNKCNSILVRATSAPIYTNSPNGVIDIRSNLAPGLTLVADAIIPAYLTWKPSVIYSLPNGKTYKFQPIQAGQSFDFTFEILLLDNTESYVGTIAEFASMFSIGTTEDHYGACANFSWVDRRNGKFKIQPNPSMVSGECYVGNIQGVDSNGNGIYLPAVRYFVTTK